MAESVRERVELEGVHRQSLAVAADLRDRAEQLSQIAARLALEADTLEAGILGTNGKLRVVRGREIVECLIELTDPGEELHYREAERRLRASGHTAGGIQPAETLLASLNRSKEFKRVGSRTGIYKRRKRRA